MWFEQHLIGSMANFGYVIGDPATKVAAVFDPSFDARVLQKAAAEHGYSIALIFNTHHHVDHMYDSLFNKVQKMDDDLVVCPGHHYGKTAVSTIGEEKQTNFTLRPRSLAEFTRFMASP